MDNGGVINFYEICGGEDAFYLITEYCERGIIYNNRKTISIYNVSSFISNIILP